MNLCDKENIAGSSDDVVMNGKTFASGDGRNLHKIDRRLKEFEKDEPLLAENPRRFVIRAHFVGCKSKMYKKAKVHQ
jgi:hypothetical protein